MRFFIKKFLQVFLYCFFSYSSFASVSTYFEQIKNDPNALYAFFKAMPKGGELHYHLLGGAYPEAMLLAAARKNYCVDPVTLVFSNNKKCTGITVWDLLQDSKLYQRILHSWSMQNFIPENTESAHEHFFSTFAKFYSLAENIYPELIVDILKRASNQKVFYLEILVMPIVPSLKDLPSPLKNFAKSDFDKRRQVLLQNPTFAKTVDESIKKMEASLAEARRQLGCARDKDKKVCQIEVRFQYYALRTQSLAAVFDQLLLGFTIAQKSSLFVGVNLVQPEDDYISLQDYKKQMQTFNFLHKIYPRVKIALHAGELNPKTVAKSAIRFHIHDALVVGNANRIGHGVDVAYENNPQIILDFMNQHKIAVEINLISNATILQIKGREHPLNYYLQHNIPVVLSTDDEGILRTDLTTQYVEATLNHHLDYSTLKQINRNALTYSFLPGKSIWFKSKPAELVPACKNLHSLQCLNFAKSNLKASLQRKLEIAMQHFEAQW